MNAEIISIGNELLIGQVVNTNASWMAEQLNLAGFKVKQVLAIADDETDILQTLREAGERSSIVLVTGGLGPTKDDITKQAICKHFNSHLVFNQEAFQTIERLFGSRGVGVTEINRKQAEIPACSIPIPNANGTAPGIWIEQHDPKKTDGTTVFVFMPGVPFEMKPMVSNYVIPKIQALFLSKAIFHKTVLTQGVGESFLSDLIEPWELALPSFITLAYLPQPGIVRLRLSGIGQDGESVKRAVMKEVEKLQLLIPDYIYGFDEDRLEELVGRMLVERGATLATAESCTGGYIAHLLTSVPGSSRYFKGSVVAYANEVKEMELGVRSQTLIDHGAVSEEVVKEMASGIRKKFKVDYAIATSGIAGPDGGTPEKPVGTTWIGLATPRGTFTSSYKFGENRERNIRKTALQALNLLRKSML